MECVENLLILSAVFTDNYIFMSDDAAGEPVVGRLKEEAANPVIRVDNQSLVPAVVEVIPEEASQGMFRQLILAELTE